jgi:predicted RNase H-like nuclease (RuvC/YqgF family)
MTYDEINDRLRLKEIGRATARLKSEGEQLEAKIEQLKREIDRLKAEIAAIQADHSRLEV